jgi:alpha/beta hydrolase family protein
LRYFGQSETAYHSQVPYGNNEKVGHYATTSDGAKIYFERYGKGSPVIILHGGLVGSTAEMGEFIDRLSQNHEVIAINTRGHGKSGVGSVAPTYAQKAADVLAVLKAAPPCAQVPYRRTSFSDGWSFWASCSSMAALKIRFLAVLPFGKMNGVNNIIAPLS